MMIAFLIAGIGLLVAGLLTVVFGVQLELTFGNTLILTGGVVACTGMMLVGVWAVLRELRNIARRLSPEVVALGKEPPMGDPAVAFRGAREQWDTRIAPPSRHQGAASREAARSDESAMPQPVEPAPAPKPRRNLLFSSSRKEREQARMADAQEMEPQQESSDSGAPVREANGPRPVSVQNPWPKPERLRATDLPPVRRSGRAPSSFAEANTGPSTGPSNSEAAGAGEQPPSITVLKSGIVDGMAYSLYSDGSIEAQMPEGMMRFASIDELRAHLDQRP
jgi:hypothetical protein